MRVNSGTDIQAHAMGGDLAALGGTATATTATSLTSSGFTASAYIGHIVVAGSVYGVIVSNTTTVLTVDRWYNPASPGGAAGTTPGATSAFTIVPGHAFAAFMALTADTGAAVATDVSLAAEIVTAGLIRKLAVYAHTTGVASYTYTAAFTAVSADVPVTVAKMAIFNTLVLTTGNKMLFETLLNATATLTTAGDQLTVTDTVTL